MWSAGGDWENPVRYFRCQCASKSKGRNEWGKYRKGEFTFIYIPDKKEGNKNLIKGEKKTWVASHNDVDYVKFDNKEDKILWDSLKKHCLKRIQAYYDDKWSKHDYDSKKLIKDHGIYDKYELQKVY